MAEAARQAEERAKIRELQARLADARARGKPVYVRYGRPPCGGHSRNGRDGGREIGLSVYPGYRLPGMRILLDLTGIDETNWYELHLTRECYLASGDEVGHGGDGEPLLATDAVVSKYGYNRALISWVKLPTGIRT